MIVSWAIMTVSLIGAYFNARGKVVGFYIWIPANVAWVVYNFSIGEPALAILFVAFTVVSSYGIYQWRKKGIK